jgi:predicted exporter
MIKPIAASAITSIITFLLLLFSAIEVFKQVAVFCASGLAVALFVALFVAPFVFKTKTAIMGNDSSAFQSSGGDSLISAEFRPLRLKHSIILLFIIFLSALISFKFVHFNASIEALNVYSKQMQEDRKVFDEMTGLAFGASKMFFVFGNSIDNVLENNEKISQQNSQYLKLASLFPSMKTKEANKKQWEKFWNGTNLKLIKNSARELLRHSTIKEDAFDGFYDFLKSGNADNSDEFNFNELFNPIIEIDGKYAFTNIVPLDAQISSIDGIETLSISNDSLQKKISDDVLSRFVKIMLVLLISSLMVLFFIFRNLRLAFLSVLPAICGISVFFIVVAILKKEINLTGLYAMPLLIGLGADYGVFMIYQKKLGTALHPTKAVAIAALSTLIGFGSLMIAKHQVLFIIGFMIFVSILTAILVSIFIIPSFLKKVDSEL